MIDAHNLPLPGAERALHGKCVYTNNTYSQAMRGYGNPQATFAIESAMDMLAEAAGIDRMEIRRINCNQPGDVTPQGFRSRPAGFPNASKRSRKNWNPVAPGRKAWESAWRP